ncbi:unnamed protein product [Leptosia nina]|uniref:Uncharacterized protein n=1 Tax=Leptosia nina TaxID=320188 RepID=A0AAV1J6C0_9NEOP
MGKSLKTETGAFGFQARVDDRPHTEISQYLACLNPVEREFVPGFSLNIVRFMRFCALLDMVLVFYFMEMHYINVSS